MLKEDTCVPQFKEKPEYRRHHVNVLGAWKKD